MSKANELSENEKHLLEHVDRFFEGTRTQEELFASLRMCFNELSEAFNTLVRNDATQEDRLQAIGKYQWASTVIPAMVRTLELGPQYDTPKLEEQLKRNFRMLMKSAKRREGPPEPH